MFCFDCLLDYLEGGLGWVLLENIRCFVVIGHVDLDGDWCVSPGDAVGLCGV